MAGSAARRSAGKRLTGVELCWRSGRGGLTCSRLGSTDGPILAVADPLLPYTHGYGIAKPES
jgi:hypothetical protein